jgi:hypothetical protein
MITINDIDAITEQMFALYLRFDGLSELATDGDLGPDDCEAQLVKALKDTEEFCQQTRTKIQNQ